MFNALVSPPSKLEANRAGICKWVAMQNSKVSKNGNYSDVKFEVCGSTRVRTQERWLLIVILSVFVISPEILEN